LDFPLSRRQVLRSMQTTLGRSLLAALAVAASLTGCSAGPLSEQLPQSLGGLPAGTPPPPATPHQYPAVHDMPPPRATEPMTEEQQYRLEKELNAVRDRQEGAQTKDQKPTKKAAKKKPAPAQTGQNAGAKTNP
jgi:hypothetical protein